MCSCNGIDDHFFHTCRQCKNKYIVWAQTYIFPHFDLFICGAHSLASCMKVGACQRKCLNENRLLQVLKYPLGFSKHTLNGGSCRLDGELSACTPAKASASKMRRLFWSVRGQFQPGVPAGTDTLNNMREWEGRHVWVTGGGAGGLRRRQRGWLQGFSQWCW